jgi:flagellar biosynthetic protein FliQ
MSKSDIMSLFYSALLIVLKIAGPILLASIAIGLVVAIFQAATQISEQTLTFLPKVGIIAVLLLILGSSMMTTFTEFFSDIFVRISKL